MTQYIRVTRYIRLPFLSKPSAITELILICLALYRALTQTTYQLSAVTRPSSIATIMKVKYNYQDKIQY